MDLFDTMIAAQLMNYEQLGLGGLVERHFSIVLDKSLTRHDWGKRPLGERYFKYLADDVIYLERLHDVLRRELREAEIEEEAEIEFRRVGRMPFGRTALDPEAFRNNQGAPGNLDQTGLSVFTRTLSLPRIRVGEGESSPLQGAGQPDAARCRGAPPEKPGRADPDHGLHPACHQPPRKSGARRRRARRAEQEKRAPCGIRIANPSCRGNKPPSLTVSRNGARRRSSRGSALESSFCPTTSVSA